MRFSLSKIFIFFTGLMLNLSFSSAQAACSVDKLAGRWVFSEYGTHVKLGSVPFSEVGWFVLRKNGRGKGQAFLSINGKAIPSLPLDIQSVNIRPRTCVGEATFSVGENLRTITFVLNSELKEFHYVSTKGDLTTLGNAKRDINDRDDNDRDD
ncbi:hypothetical protein [Nitrosococcus wardiae]|uniref:Lipocalin-like domain-containing protein n=1 Tax=Nitrosococcus wardiae TaxID=1814290 RepID=A0A4P7C3A7_9GAMM|nr:hypothetical protein [Nitrosococcus wardiae]QBQ55386.1 hypothetical protein E3U44_13340 [Nitrosococcus wardiae]